MAKGEIYLSVYGGTTTGAPSLLDAKGREFSLGTVEIARKTRTANARLVKDIVDSKANLSLNYSMIDKTSLDQFEAFYNLDTELYLTVFNTDIDIDQYIVLMQPIPKRSRLRLGADGLYRNVSIKFEEV